MLRRLTPFQLTADIVVGVLWALFGLLILTTNDRAGLFAIVVVLLIAAAYAVRRLSPGIALAVAWAGSVLQVLLWIGPSLFDVPIFAVVYATAAYGERVVRMLGLISAPVGAAVIALSPLVAGTYAGDPARFGPIVLPAVAWGGLVTFIVFLIAFLLAWTFGSLVRSVRLSREARRAEAEAQREIVVQQERNRIARDLHDVVAHSLAVVIAQADGARYASDVAVKDGALATIAATGREALGDVRLLLARLRHEEGAEPAPSLADLDDLIEQVRASGLNVRLERSGTPLPLPPGQQLAVYRIVQEALTNALRHGDAAQPVTVALRWQTDALAVEVVNATSAQPRPDGHGLPGMRERASLAGGTLTAEPDGRWWRVSATVPAKGAA